MLTWSMLFMPVQEEDAVVVGLDASEQLTFVRVPQGATHTGAEALDVAMAAACVKLEDGGKTGLAGMVMDALHTVCCSAPSPRLTFVSQPGFCDEELCCLRVCGL